MLGMILFFMLEVLSYMIEVISSFCGLESIGNKLGNVRKLLLELLKYSNIPCKLVHCFRTFWDTYLEHSMFTRLLQF